MSGVILIGQSGAGKTSNIYMSYGILKNLLRSDPLFREAQVSVSENPHLERAYGNAMAGRGVVPTSDIRNDRFSLMVRGRWLTTNLMDYEVIDTIGGDSVSDKDSERMRLMRAFSKASYVVLFFSCEDLLPRTDHDLQRNGEQLDRILDIINDWVLSMPGDLHLEIVFTMYDRLKDSERDSEEILELFGGLLDNNNHPNFLVEHFFVSNNPLREKDAELPILSVLTRKAVNDLKQECRERRLPRLSLDYRLRVKAVKALCEYLGRETGQIRWKLLGEDLLTWKP